MSHRVVRVTIVFSEDLSPEDLRAIVETSPSWVAGSQANRAAADTLWPRGRGLAGSLSFFTVEPDAITAVLAQVDEDMEEVGWDRGENEVDVLGCADIAACEDALRAAGFVTVRRESGRIIARRPPIRRPTREEFDAWLRQKP